MMTWNLGPAGKYKPNGEKENGEKGKKKFHSCVTRGGTHVLITSNNFDRWTSCKSVECLLSRRLQKEPDS